MSGSEVVLLTGCPGAGKTSLVNRFPNYHRINRDTLGGTLKDLGKHLRTALSAGATQIIMDNTFPTIESRKPVIEVAREFGIPIRCMHLNTNAVEARTNVALRMIAKYGKVLGPDEMKVHSKGDPGLFPPIVISSYFERFQRATRREGFSEVDTVKFRRAWDPSYNNLALLLDYDGTLRRTRSRRPCPYDPRDVEILPNRRETLLEWQAKGYRLLGISNQADIARGLVSYEQIVACFEETNRQLGLDIEYVFCPHAARPVMCYCRKPGTALGVQFIEKYKLNRRKLIMVGDRASDNEFASNIPIKYVDQKEFFAV